MIRDCHNQRDWLLRLEVLLHDPPLKYLRNRIGGNQTELAQHGPLTREQFSRAIPPVHDEISGLVHM